MYIYVGSRARLAAANLRTEIPDFGGFDSIVILILRGGILMSIGDFQEILSRRILAGSILAQGDWAYQAAQRARREFGNSGAPKRGKAPVFSRGEIPPMQRRAPEFLGSGIPTVEDLPDFEGN